MNVVRRVSERKIRSSPTGERDLWEYRIYVDGLLVEVIYSHQRLNRQQRVNG